MEDLEPEKKRKESGAGTRTGRNKRDRAQSNVEEKRRNYSNTLNVPHILARAHNCQTCARATNHQRDSF